MSLDPWLVAELAAVGLNHSFTFLIMVEKRAGWVLGFTASCISVALYQHNRAWAMTLLNVFYAVMAVYGGWSWGRAHDDRIRRRPPVFHLRLLLAGLAAAGALGWGLDRWVHGAHPYMDAFITVFAFIATWMMARRLLENWIWWVIGDLVAVYFNHLLGLRWYALLNVAYIILSMAGLWRWGRAYRAQQRGVTA
jgi:nicotinamide mononucleotide transporter